MVALLLMNPPWSSDRLFYELVRREVAMGSATQLWWVLRADELNTRVKRFRRDVGAFPTPRTFTVDSSSILGLQRPAWKLHGTGQTLHYHSSPWNRHGSSRTAMPSSPMSPGAAWQTYG